MKGDLAMANVHTKKRRVTVLVLLALLLAVGIGLFYNFVIEANKTTSPDGAYQVSYNRLTKVITVRRLGTDIRWYEGECEEPTFLWSPDSRYLARNISGANGIRRAEIMDMERSVSMTTLAKEGIQQQYEQTRTQNQESGECVEIVRWLDNEHVLMEFSWPSDIPGETMSGWCVYDFAAWNIELLNVRI